jgi:two-component system KDP operon response regulator KdpE
MREPQGKVLIVDDESAVRRALRGTLHGLGFEVLAAASGEEAIHLMKAIRYDALVLDISMPGMGGLAACLELRRLRPRLGILMLTIHDDYETKVQALDAGADDYVTKPCHIGELAARLRALIRRSRSLESKTGFAIKIGESNWTWQGAPFTGLGNRSALPPKSSNCSTI